LTSFQGTDPSPASVAKSQHNADYPTAVSRSSKTHWRSWPCGSRRTVAGRASLRGWSAASSIGTRP